MVDTHPHRRPVCGCTGVNTVSVSLWCANIKAASELLVTEKKVYLKIKLYPSLSRTEKSTRWSCVFIPPPSGSSAGEGRNAGLVKPQRHSVLRFRDRYGWRPRPQEHTANPPLNPEEQKLNKACTGTKQMLVVLHTVIPRFFHYLKGTFC